MTAQKIFVIKFGGAAMQDPAAAESLFSEIAELRNIGVSAVVVHGGGPEIDVMLKRLSIVPKKDNGRRITDDATLEVVEMVLAGVVNKRLVTFAQRAGLPAVGLSGIDGGIADAEKLVSAGVDLGHVGRVSAVRCEVPRLVMQAGYLPILCSLSASPNGEHFNINADDFAAAIASELEADTLVLMTDVPGIMRRYPDVSTLVPRFEKNEARKELKGGTISSGMIPKVEACLAALDAGVSQTIITDGRGRSMTKFARGEKVDFATVIA